MHNADRWEAYANGIVQDEEKRSPLRELAGTDCLRPNTRCESVRRCASFQCSPETSSIEYSLWLKGNKNCPRSGPFVVRLETLVITEHTHSENNDWQKPVEERSSASEMFARPPIEALPSQDGEPKGEVETPASEKLSAPGAEDDTPGTAQEQPAAQEESSFFATSDEREARSETSSDLAAAAVSNEQSTPASEAPGSFEDALPSPALDEAGSSGQPDEATRPFTDFIEEFRQTEERFSARLQEAEATFTTFSSDSETVQEPVVSLETPAEVSARAIDEVSAPLSEAGQEQQGAEAKSEAVPAAGAASEETSAVPAPPADRPVSPLLRPPRMRLPRHSRHRAAEQAAPVVEVPPEEPKVPAEQPTEEAPAAEEVPQEEQPARPARRYRFDRPAATASANLSTAKISVSPTSSRASESKEKKGTGQAAHKENGVSPEPATARAAGTVAETPAQKPQVQETTPAVAEVTPPVSERRRRGGNHDRQREKEQPAAPAAQVQEPAAPPAPEPVPFPEADIPVEDLPPLEYSELQAASSRRRRRRRAGSASTTAATNGAIPVRPVAPEPPASVPPVSPFAPPKIAPVQPTSYNIVSGYTVSQMNQGNDSTGPFMGPEPSPARGSTFSTPPSLRHVRGEALRAASAHPAKHTESPLMSAASVNYLANAVSQAIQAQTDRMVAEWRRVSQAPTNVSVSLPPFPSTERVGVFVDVANLLYSARTLRITIDFGKLLDFLRGNRRLVRAQAYCPTSPQPGDDQMFLQAVKGLGYRITTKNYKTFSSGAKKADLDLDLCMDVVRLVDGKAVDCIVLVSGDSDFMPMLDYCSDHGVRVEVAAFDESMSATLRQSCDLFVNLSMLEEIRA